MAKRFIAGLLAGLAIWPAGAAAAGAGTLYGRVLHTYQAHGSIPPCQFTSPQLAAALASVDTYGQQYYADFIQAIQSALAARASGVCSGTHHLGGAGASAHAASGPRLPSSITAPTGSGVPAPLIALAVAAALLASAALLARAARRRPGPTDWSHGWAETRYRMGGFWAALAGRLRR